MQKSNIVVGGITVLFGLLILYLSRDMSMYDEYGVPGERFWPFGLACLFIGLGVLQWLEVMIQRRKGQPDVSVSLFSVPMQRAYLAAVVMLGYGVLLYFAGFIIASLILVALVMWMMGENRPISMALTSLAVVASIYLFFEVMFNSPLPISIFSE
jgi:putative tricarboxylic transport membrane protein